jgi:hypothetical protein
VGNSSAAAEANFREVGKPAERQQRTTDHTEFTDKTSRGQAFQSVAAGTSVVEIFAVRGGGLKSPHSRIAAISEFCGSLAARFRHVSAAAAADWLT